MENTGGANGHTGVPQDEIIDLWHEILPECLEVKVWNEGRRALLATRWREDQRHQTLEFWRGLFKHIRDSDFLMGRTGSRDKKPFLLSLPWLLEPEHFALTIEADTTTRRKKSDSWATSDLMTWTPQAAAGWSSNGDNNAAE